MTSNDVSIVVTYFVVPMVRCLISWCFRRYRNSWYWGSEVWGNERIEMLERVFAKECTDASMQAVETVLQNIHVAHLNDKHIHILTNILKRIRPTCVLSSHVVCDLWNVHLCPTREPALLDLYFVAVEHSDPLGAPYPMPPIPVIMGTYHQLSCTEVLWKGAFGNQRYKLLFESLRYLDGASLNVAFANVMETTAWQEDGDHLSLLYDVVRTIQPCSAVSGMNVTKEQAIPVMSPLHAARGITVTPDQVFQCANQLSHASPENSWRCLWQLCNTCHFGVQGVACVEFELIAEVQHRMHRVANEHYELYNHIPFECAVNLLYHIRHDPRVELSLGDNVWRKITPPEVHTAVNYQIPFFGEQLYYAQRPRLATT